MKENEPSESQSKLSMTQYLKYVNNDWAKGWLQRGKADRHGVFVSREFMQAAKGNAYDAILLSQILYWADIDMVTRSPRLRHQYKKHWWIVKTYDEWADEVCFNSGRTVSQCLNRLAKHGLIFKETHKSPFHQTGQVASYVRPNWKSIEAALNNQTTQHVDRSKETPKRHNMSIQKIHIMSFQKRHIMSILYIQRLLQRLHTKTTKKKDSSPAGESQLFSTIEERHGVGVGEDWLAARWQRQGIKPKKGPKHYRHYQQLLMAFGEDETQLTKTVKKTYYAAAAALLKTGFPARLIQYLHHHVQDKAALNGWSTFGVMALVKYREEYLKLRPKFAAVRPLAEDQPAVDPDITIPEDFDIDRMINELALEKGWFDEYTQTQREDLTGEAA